MQWVQSPWEVVDRVNMRLIIAVAAKSNVDLSAGQQFSDFKQFQCFKGYRGHLKYGMLLSNTSRESCTICRMTLLPVTLTDLQLSYHLLEILNICIMNLIT